MRPSAVLPALLAALPHLALAKTDLDGCVSSDTVAFGGASVIWYVPDTGEVCEFLDCGGGRAPPKTTVPGCPQYEGNDSYSPSFLALSTAMESEGAEPTGTAPITSAPDAQQTGAPDEEEEEEGEEEETGAPASGSEGTATVTGSADGSEGATGTDASAAASDTGAAARVGVMEAVGVLAGVVAGIAAI